jgi:hypothetical protein
MESFKLNNLRNLSTEEQMRLKGGSMPENCSANCGTCSCYCKCDNQNPSKSVGESSADSGSKSQSQRKQAQEMQKM